MVRLTDQLLTLPTCFYERLEGERLRVYEEPQELTQVDASSHPPSLLRGYGSYTEVKSLIGKGAAVDLSPLHIPFTKYPGRHMCSLLMSVGV